MFRKPLLILTILLSAAIFRVHAQEDAKYVGIDTLCGDSALRINSVDSLPEDATTQPLDLLLRQYVTLPSDDVPPVSLAEPKPPAPGGVIFVDSPDGRYFRSIGVRDIESCAPIDPRTPFPIGSNTKMITAAVIYQLQEEGLLSTSDLVSQYLPDEIALFEGAEPIAIDMLLGHTSGLPDYLNSKNPRSLGSRLFADEPGLLETAFTPEELVRIGAIDPLVFAPGSEAQWSYSNTGYIMLGQIIEQVTGQGYIEAVTERIIDRLGLQHTVLVPEFPSADLNLTGQYLISPFTRDTSSWNFSQAWSAGDAVSTPEDMAVFLRAYYSGELYHDPATLEAMMTRAAPGFFKESDDYYYMHGGYYKAGFLGHGGQTLGTESDVGYNPELDMVIITWANSSDANTARGIFHIGHVLGVTPSWDEAYAAFPFNQVSDASEFQTLSVQDVLGTTFDVLGVYISSTQEDKRVPEGSTYTLRFNADGQMSIVADCNTVTATYTTGEDKAIDIELGTSTMAACAGESIADDLLAVLDAASTVNIVNTGSQILLTFTADDESYVFLSK